MALIAGPSGEEIFTNGYGQVKEWFPWDRRARKGGTDTVWICVGQPWAGTMWGYQVIPRIGIGCLISYQEGDPDRPFIIMAWYPIRATRCPKALDATDKVFWLVGDKSAAVFWCSDAGEMLPLRHLRGLNTARNPTWGADGDAKPPVDLEQGDLLEAVAFRHQAPRVRSAHALPGVCFRSRRRARCRCGVCCASQKTPR